MKFKFTPRQSGNNKFLIQSVLDYIQPFPESDQSVLIVAHNAAHAVNLGYELYCYLPDALSVKNLGDKVIIYGANYIIKTVSNYPSMKGYKIDLLIIDSADLFTPEDRMDIYLSTLPTKAIEINYYD